jgi:hypothetical protein
MGGSKTTYSYSYEPDRVKAAEIQKEKSIILAKMQQENIQLNQKAELELMQANANFQLTMLKAKEEGFTNVMVALTNLMKEWNIISEQRIALMNNAKFDTSSKINRLYSDLISKVDEDSFDFQLNKQPKLFEQLEKCKDTGSYESYRKSLDLYIANFINEKSEMVKSYSKQQEILIQSTLNSIDTINSEVTQIVMTRVDSLTRTIQIDKDYRQLADKNKELNVKEKNLIEDKNSSKI